MNRHFQHLVSLSLSLSGTAWGPYLCGLAGRGGAGCSVSDPPAPPTGPGRRSTPSHLLGAGNPGRLGPGLPPRGCGAASLLHTGWGWQPWSQPGWGWTRQDAGVVYFMVGIAAGVPAGCRHPHLPRSAAPCLPLWIRIPAAWGQAQCIALAQPLPPWAALPLPAQRCCAGVPQSAGCCPPYPYRYPGCSHCPPPIDCLYRGGCCTHEQSCTQ